MKIVFLITARLKSKRLPKKIILEVNGKPLISHMIDRVKQSKFLDEIVICTSTNEEDSPLVDIALDNEVLCYRGSEEDVLERLSDAATEYSFDYVSCITADCPLIESSIIDRIIKMYLKKDADLITSFGMPYGQCPYGIKPSSLKKVCEIKEETETEVWVNYFIQSGLFKIHQLDIDENLTCPDLKTTLDYPEDFNFIKKIFETLYEDKKYFSLIDIIDLVRKNPNLLSINKHRIEDARMHIEQTSSPVKFRSELINN